MIIGGNKDKVIDNIIKNIENNELNKKVEVNDPILTEEELNAALKRFYGIRKHKIIYFLESRFAYLFVDILGRRLNNSVRFR